MGSCSACDGYEPPTRYDPDPHTWYPYPSGLSNEDYWYSEQSYDWEDDDWDDDDWDYHYSYWSQSDCEAYYKGWGIALLIICIVIRIPTLIIQVVTLCRLNTYM